MTTKKNIPVSSPVLNGNEREYVLDCIDSTWISSAGHYIDRFEESFADYCKVKHAISCCNGTAALHLALMALGVTKNDEVIVPTLTYVSTANAVTYCGASPVFVDSEIDTWNIDPNLIEKRINKRTKGIIVVHLYGHPVDMDPILAIAHRHNLFVIEDAAQAHGATYKGRMVGSMGDAATFSFYGNKIISTGEGGMVVTENEELSNKIRYLKGQGMDPARRYWFPMIGYNYRMTNIAAAIGLAQLEKSSWHEQRRSEIVARYKERLTGITGLSWQANKEWAKHAHWMFTVMLDNNMGFLRDDIMAGLEKEGIETRPVFYPMHSLPPYSNQHAEDSFPTADLIAQRGINLPTWAAMTPELVDYVCSKLKALLSMSQSQLKEVV